MSILNKLNKSLEQGFSTADYLITFKDKIIFDVHDYPELLSCGAWIHSKGNYVRVQTTLNEADLSSLICKVTSLTRDMFIITNAAGLYFGSK